jgi:integrase
MRARSAYSVYRRVLPSGEVVYYYQTYDDEGRRLPGRSTGKGTRTAARAYCDGLLKEGLMGTGEENRRVPLFKDFAKGWWVLETCEYMQEKEAGGNGLTRGTEMIYRNNLNRHILPVFGNRRLDKITDEDVRLWRLALVKQGLHRNTVKVIVTTFSTMLGYAKAHKGYIKYNPCHDLGRWSTASAVPDILKPGEIRALFPDEWSTVWDEYGSYVLCKTAAHTGLRFGELLGIRGDHVYKNHIFIEDQYTLYGPGPLKTKKGRTVTIPAGVYRDLDKLRETRGNGYLFTAGSRYDRPMRRDRVYRNLYGALNRIGINEAEREKRNLSVHGFRHFFNTYLLAGNINDSKVMALTGHTNNEIKKRYTHFDSEDFKEVLELQERLLGQGPGEGPDAPPPDGAASGEAAAGAGLPGNIRLFRLPVAADGPDRGESAAESGGAGEAVLPGWDYAI